MEELREELLRGTVSAFPAEPKILPLAHHLRRVAEALSVAGQESRRAAAFGRQYELAQWILDDVRGCDQDRLNQVMVYLPRTRGYGGGEGEPGCPMHAAAALAAMPGAYAETPSAS
ncbi:hypothetical protein ACFV1N_25540 [Streptosporangium canum]|uniref:hypothetical protein n=1 Tax=Streptosporangium canum TaxID=324952 RepID=UPI0036C59E8C